MAEKQLICACAQKGVWAAHSVKTAWYLTMSEKQMFLQKTHNKQNNRFEIEEEEVEVK